jgi:GNAT superfamily N-acetyltransferase
LSWEDPQLWGEAGCDGRAAYIHGVAVRRIAGGQGVGEHIIRWAEQETVAKGRLLLRLDCMRDNPGLRKYYEKIGFLCVGEWQHPTLAAALYEKSVRS